MDDTPEEYIIDKNRLDLLIKAVFGTPLEDQRPLAQRHTGLDQSILEKRRKLYEAARAVHLERLSRNVRNWFSDNYVDKHRSSRIGSLWKNISQYLNIGI